MIQVFLSLLDALQFFLRLEQFKITFRDMKTGLGSKVDVLEHLTECGQQSVRANRDGYLPLPIYGGPGRIRLVAIHRDERVSKEALHAVVPAVRSRLAPCDERK